MTTAPAVPFGSRRRQDQRPTVHQSKTRPLPRCELREGQLVPMSAFYSIDSTRVSHREYWWGTRSPAVLIGWLLKWLRVRIPSSTDDPNVESTLPFLVEALPADVAQRFEPRAAEFDRVGVPRSDLPRVSGHGNVHDDLLGDLSSFLRAALRAHSPAHLASDQSGGSRDLRPVLHSVHGRNVRRLVVRETGPRHPRSGADV